MPTCTCKAVKESNASSGEQKIVDLLDRLQRLLYPSPLTQNGEKSHCAGSSSCRNGSCKMSDAPHASAFLGFSALSLSFAQTRTNQPSLLSSVAPLVAALLLLPPGSFSTRIRPPLRPPPAPSPPPLWIQSLGDLQPPSGRCSAVGSRATSNPAGAEQPPRRRAPAQIRQVTTFISPSKVQIWRGIASSSRFRRVDLRARWVDGARPFPAPHGSGSPSLSCGVGTFSLAAA
jgi:hypothetical protein